MPSVNKPSLRDEFEVLKGRFGQLSKDEKIPEESHDLFEDLLTLLSVLMAAFLEKNTPKSSANSSQPPVPDPQGRERARSRRRPHQGPGPRPEPPGEHPHGRDRRCLPGPRLRDLRRGPAPGPLPGPRAAHPDRFVFEKVLRHVDAEIKACPHCGGETRGAFPEAFSGPVQYGAGIKAYILNLVTARMIPLRRVQQSLQNLIGLTIAEATILKYVQQLYRALERWERQAIERILTHPTMHLDETSLRVAKRNHWIHGSAGINRHRVEDERASH